jgi:hypothetical protein
VNAVYFSGLVGARILPSSNKEWYQRLVTKSDGSLLMEKELAVLLAV